VHAAQLPCEGARSGACATQPEVMVDTGQWRSTRAAVRAVRTGQLRHGKVAAVGCPRPRCVLIAPAGRGEAENWLRYSPNRPLRRSPAADPPQPPRSHAHVAGRRPLRALSARPEAKGVGRDGTRRRCTDAELPESHARPCAAGLAGSIANDSRMTNWARNVLR